MKKSARLIFTIGLARCGKSTFCDRWVNGLEMTASTIADEEGDIAWGRPRAIVCSDDIRMSLHGERFNRDAEPMVWSVHTYMCKSLLRRGHDVIIDGTNTTRDSILRIMNIDTNACYILIDTPMEECERRAMACGHHDLVEHGVIRRQARQLRALKDRGLDVVVEGVRERVKRRWGLT
jgi:predicted kinase